MATRSSTIVVDDQEALRVPEGIARVLDFSQLERFLQGPATDHLHERASNRFRAEGDAAVGGRWQVLAPATKRIRAKAGYGASHPINRRTSELWDFVTMQSGRTSSFVGGAILTMPGNGTQEEEAKLKVAQQGKHDGAWNVPARPVMALDGRDSSTLTKLFAFDFESHLERFVRTGTL